MMAALKLALPNEEFVVFDDDPVPSLQESFWMFRHAKLIIAGHGASQTNIIACREGTILVEMLTNDHDIQVAYAVIGQQLGMVYHGFAPKHSAYRGQITADIDRLVGIVEKLKL